MKLDPKSPAIPSTLGVAEYRSGHWQAAIAALERSMSVRNGGDSTEWFFLAMSYWQLGEKEKAGKWFDDAVRWGEKNKPADEELRAFRAEAAELMGVKEK
jgi:eukaryotic-like serine/threonine-protein kinase